VIQLELFKEELSLSKTKLSTNLTTGHYPIHRWFNFIAGFSPEFVGQCLREAGLSSDDVLIDPFAGLSTALVQANFSGIPSIGFEAHPFFYDISRAKVYPPTKKRQIDDVEALCRLAVEPFAGNLTDVWTKDAIAYLTKLVPDPDLRSLARAVLLEDRVNSDAQPLYRLVISKVLELTACSQTDGVYKAPTTAKTSTRYHIALAKVCHEIRQDVEAIDGEVASLATIHHGSSERMNVVADQSCSLCVTSPPYLNNFDFAEMTRMELYFWRYAGSWGDITEKVRRNLIVNTTTAPTDLKRSQARFAHALSLQLRARLQPLVAALEQQRRIKPGKKDYYLLVYPYFAQMQSVIRELQRTLKPNSSLHMVVADAALYGVHIQTELLLAEVMRENGFQVLGIESLRVRGDRWRLTKRQGANGPLGEFHIHAQRI